MNDEIVGRCLADGYRADLQRAGVGDGRHAFDFVFGSPLSLLDRSTVAVRREGDGAHLEGSPRRLEPSSSFDQNVQENIGRILTTVADEAELARRLAFLADQSDRIRQLHADANGGAAERQFRRDHLLADPRGRGPGPGRPRALFIDERTPLPQHDAGSDALISHMRAVKRLGYDVAFAPAHSRGDASLLEAEGITRCSHPWYASVEEVLGRQRDAFALIYLHRVSMASRYLALARHYQPKARILFSVADLHHLRLARQAKVEQRPELARLGERMRVAEFAAAEQSDAVITHSTEEAEALRRHLGASRVHVIPWSVAPRPTATPFAERRGFAFVGGYQHQPNVDAAHWLVEHIMPELEAQGAAIACSLLGSDMPDALRKLRGPRVDPVGYVPDLAAALGRLRLTVAPLAYGAGVKGKVLASLAAGVPCVCTPAAAEGLDLPDLLLKQVASTPSKLAGLIKALHEDEDLNKACALAGLAYISATTSETRVDRLLQRAIGRRTLAPAV